MVQRDMLKRYLDAGMAFTAMTKSRAEGIVREMVKAGEVERDQVQGRVEDLIDRSRRNTDHLIALVRKEVISQLADLGLATRRDLEKLERRFRGALGSDTKASGAQVTQADAAPAKRPPGRPKGSGTTKAATPKKAATTRTAATTKAATATKAAATKTAATTKAATTKTAATTKAATTKTAATTKAAATKTAATTKAAAGTAAATKKAATRKRAPAKADPPSSNAGAAPPAPSDSPARGNRPSAPAS